MTHSCPDCGGVAIIKKMHHEGKRVSGRAYSRFYVCVGTGKIKPCGWKKLCG